MYGRTLLSHITADGRLHPSLLLDGTASGRLSSQDPNAQNFPRADTAEGKLLRDCFIAAAGWEFVEADESQVEIRVAADLSQDPVLLADFAAGIDIHLNNATECCEIVWKIPRSTWDAMTKKERAPYRTQIKTATFGRMYGKTAWGLAKEWGVSVAQVETLLNKIWGKYKVLDRWFKKQITDAQKTGVVWTDWQGKRAKHRALWAIADQDEKKRGHAERQALNTPIQGTAAEYTTASLDLIHQWLDANNLAHLAEIIMTVHDSIIMHCHKSVSEKVARAVRKIMTAHKTNGVVLAVDLKKGSTLGSMVDYELAA
jgi:DNA polymerase-1